MTEIISHPQSQEDRVKILAHLSSCFPQIPSEFFRAKFFGYAGYEYRHSYCLNSDNCLVSFVQIIPMTLLWGGASALVYGIGGVSTIPSWRSQGCVRRLIARIRFDYPDSPFFLFTRTPKVYQSAGFQLTAKLSFHLADPAKRKNIRDDLRVAPLDWDQDTNSLRGIHAHFISQLYGCRQRLNPDWDTWKSQIIQDPSIRSFSLRKGAELEGYGIVRNTTNGPRLVEYGIGNPKHLDALTLAEQIASIIATPLMSSSWGPGVAEDQDDTQTGPVVWMSTRGDTFQWHLPPDECMMYFDTDAF